MPDRKPFPNQNRISLDQAFRKTLEDDFEKCYDCHEQHGMIIDQIEMPQLLVLFFDMYSRTGTNSQCIESNIFDDCTIMGVQYRPIALLMFNVSIRHFTCYCRNVNDVWYYYYNGMSTEHQEEKGFARLVSAQYPTNICINHIAKIMLQRVN